MILVPPPHASRRCLTAALLLTFASLPFLTFAELRKWTNASGASIEAEMVSVDIAARTITIKRADGQTFTIPIDSLSPADRTFAAEQWKAIHAKGAAPAATAPAAAPGTAAVPAPAAAAPAPGKPAPPRPQIAITPANKFKIPSSAEYLRTVQKTRPRLIHAAAGWAYAKSMLGDPAAAKLLEAVKKAGEAVLEAPELTRIFGEQRGPISAGSKAVFRMATLGALHFLDGDPRWKERGVRELIALTDPATFQNWYVDEPEVTAEFLTAAALGYDWFRDGLNAQQATASRTYMIEKGIGALEAHIKGEPVPESARGKAAGVTSAPKAKAPAKGGAKKQQDEADLPPDEEHMAMASALILAGICLIDEDPAAGKSAVDAAAKVFGKGLLQFAPAGIWPEGIEKGERVLDHAIMVLQTLRANSGADLGFSLLEGIPQSGIARLHLVGPTNQLFNYGDSEGSTLTRPWVATWLAGMHGNVGTRAVAPRGGENADSAFLGNAGHLMYFNPHAAGNGNADSLDYVIPGGIVAAVRSAWNDPNAFYAAVKGGDNSMPIAQLDLGSFVLDAGGQRWAIELGAESDRAPDFKPAADRTKRYQLYIEGTLGQNAIVIGGNQEFDAKAAVLTGHSSPATGLGVIDVSEAYSKALKDHHRGIMVLRGQQPSIVIQDDMLVKNSSNLTWRMHTRATISPSGNKVTLTLGKQTLTGVILSPANATFSQEDPPEPKSERMTKLTGIHVLKIAIPEVKGPQSISVAFALGAEAPQVQHKPIAEWVPKK